MAGAGSDHRILRARIRLELKLERRKFIESTQNTIAHIPQSDYFKKQFIQNLKNELKSEDVNSLNEHIVVSTQNAVKQVRTKTPKAINRPVCSDVEKLIQELAEILRTPDQIEIGTINSSIKHLIGKQLREKKHKLILETIEKHRGPSFSKTTQTWQSANAQTYYGRECRDIRSR